MALAERTTRVQNPGRNRPRRKLSEKQLAFFGTRRQRAAMARRKAARRAHASAGARHHKRGTPSRAVRRNVGEVLSMTLVPALAGNPAGKVRGMAKAKTVRNRVRSHRTGQYVGRRRNARARFNGPGRRRHNEPGRRRMHNTRRPRRNPGEGGIGIGSLVYSSLFVIVGAVGSKLLTQAVLSTSNTGVMGYFGNAVATAGLAFITHKFMRNPAAARAIATGGVVQIVLRILSDYTPLGTYTSSLGLGDYEVSNFVTPQRYVDALHSAQVEIPAGWAPTVVTPAVGTMVASGGGGRSAAGGGMGYYGGGLYSPAGGLY